MLSAHDLTTAYEGLVAISGVSIEVAKGEIVCVAGANGAGKSTLLKTIAGAERPRTGTVTFDGQRIDGMTGFGYDPTHSIVKARQDGLRMCCSRSARRSIPPMPAISAQ